MIYYNKYDIVMDLIVPDNKPIQNGLKPSRYAPTFNIRDNEKKTLTKQ